MSAKRLRFQLTEDAFAHLVFENRPAAKRLWTAVQRRQLRFRLRKSAHSFKVAYARSYLFSAGYELGADGWSYVEN